MAMYNDNSRHKCQEFVAHSMDVTCVSLGSKSQQILATGGEDCRVNIWRVGSTDNLWTLGSNKSPIQCLCFDSDEQNVVSGTRSGSIKVFDLNEGRLARQLTGHAVNVNCLQYHGFGEFIASGSVDCTMKVWDVRSKNCLQTYTGHDKEVTCVRFSPDGRWVASSAKDGQLHIWDLVAGKLLRTIKTAPAYVSAFEFNPEDLILAGACSNRAVRFWDLESFQNVFSTSADSNPLRCITFNPQGNMILSATKDALRAWSWESQSKLLGSLPMTWDKVSELKVLSDNTVLGVSYVSNFVSIWSTEVNDVLAQKNASSSDDAKPVPVAPSKVSNSSSSDRSKSTSGASVHSQSNNTTSANNSNSNNMNNAQQPLPSSSSSSDESRAPEVFRAAPYKAMFPGRDATPSTTGLSSQVGPSGGPPEAKGVGNGRRSPATYIESKCDDWSQGGQGQVPSGAGAVGSRPVSQPVVEWSSESAARDLASSMGESFWKKFQRSTGLDDKDSEQPSSASAASGPTTSASRQDNVDVDDDAMLRAAEDGDISEDRLSEIARQIEEINSKFDQVKLDSSDDAKHTDVSGNSGISSNRVGSSNSYNNNNISGNSNGNGNGFELRGQRVSSSSSQSSQRSTSRSKDSKDCKDTTPIPQSQSQAPPSSSSVAAAQPSASRLDRMLSSPSHVPQLTQRLTTLKVLRRHWDRGDLRVILDHMQTMQESLALDPLAVVVPLADFLATTDWKGPLVTLDVCCKLLPVIEAIVSVPEGWQSEHVLMASLSTVISLWSGFGDLIRQNRVSVTSMVSVGGAHGVDLSREERSRKCQGCYNCVAHIAAKLDVIKVNYRDRRPLLDLFAKIQSYL